MGIIVFAYTALAIAMGTVLVRETFGPVWHTYDRATKVRAVIMLITFSAFWPSTVIMALAYDYTKTGRALIWNWFEHGKITTANLD